MAVCLSVFRGCDLIIGGEFQTYVLILKRKKMMTKEDALWLELKQSLQTNTCQEGMITDHFSIIQCAGVQAVVVEEGRPTFICKSMCRVAVVSLMSVLGTSLLCMYAKCGSRYDACRVFQQDAHLHSM